MQSRCDEPAIIENSCCLDEKGKGSLEIDASIGTNAFKDVTKEKTFDLHLVSPFTSGEGWPYAPQGWPNLGDVWGWKVGRRTDKAGYYQDRFLFLPKSLQRSGKTVKFLSKLDVTRYLKSNFPDMKIEDFFALFSWKVPSTDQTRTKAVQTLFVTPLVKSPEIGDATKENDTRQKLKRKTSSFSQPTRKSSRLFHVHSPLTPDQDSNEVIDLSHLNEGTRIDTSMNVYDNIDAKKGSGMHATEETVIENFDEYLDALEDILVMPDIVITPSDHMATATSGDDEMKCWKNKLSSLLNIDFPSLVSCNDAVEAATLALQIRKDPNLSIDQLAKLKLVEQIPLYSETFLEAKRNIEEADGFLAELEARKLKAPEVKNEYNELKEQIAQRDTEMERSSSAIQEIDDQIRQLESKRNEISRVLETMQRSKVELTSRLTNVANSIPTLVSGIQHGLSQKSNWELKKVNCAKRMAEIQGKFITLRGLSF
ncbi:hypothetical protein Fmac_003483 [Flemingia macrophylla]|uniref:DUF7081 domain-containing protein n=1 Tax=Flemingia macrophylla TaxID=520843 RepID=A0ABD1NMW2_9FABA